MRLVIIKRSNDRCVAWINSPNGSERVGAWWGTEAAVALIKIVRKHLRKSEYSVRLIEKNNTESWSHLYGNVPDLSQCGLFRVMLYRNHFTLYTVPRAVSSTSPISTLFLSLFSFDSEHDVEMLCDCPRDGCMCRDICPWCARILYDAEVGGCRCDTMSIDIIALEGDVVTREFQNAFESALLQRIPHACINACDIGEYEVYTMGLLSPQKLSMHDVAHAWRSIGQDAFEMDVRYYFSDYRGNGRKMMDFTTAEQE